MRIFLKLFLVLFATNAFADCSFRKDVSVISLSGTTTVLFKHLGLLNDLKGISVFNPISEEEYKGKVYPGGIFLSHRTLDEFKGHYVFFDESRELEKIFKSKNLKTIEVFSRNQTPSETIHSALKQIIPLVEGCEKQTAAIEALRVSLENKIMNAIPVKKNILFFLGEIKTGRLPEMVVANDGVIKWLREKGKIATYPSELAYVNWSSKIMQELSYMTKVGINDPARGNKKNLNGSNLFYQGSLVPGLSQLEAFAFLFGKLK